MDGASQLYAPAVHPQQRVALHLPLGAQSFAPQYSVDTARVLAFTSGGLTGAVKG